MGRRGTGSAERAGFHDLPVLAHLRAGGRIRELVCADDSPLAGRASIRQSARKIPTDRSRSSGRCIRNVARRTKVQTSVEAGFGLGSNRNLKARFSAQVQPQAATRSVGDLRVLPVDLR